MTKKILRIVSLVLAMLLLVCLFPQAKTAAVQTEAYRITQLAESNYKAALKKVGRSSFHGYCGDAVSWQLQMLGITTKFVGANGNGQYDAYKNDTYSTGGYRIHAYSAASYNLKEALNILSENGTKNAYNILVGFQRTNTTAGRKYGHVVFIYGIIDGMVYFVESFTETFGGKKYPEGKCIALTIDQFAKYYNSWTTLDGLISFGLKTYNDLCEEYPAYLYAGVTQDTYLYTAPCTPDVDDRSQLMRAVQAGERLSVTGMYLNTEGEYWYRVEDYQTGYVRADMTQVQGMRYDDVTATGISAPTVHQQGNTFNVKGTISSTYNAICSVRGQVFEQTGDGMLHKMTTTATVEDNRYSLSYSTISNRLAFRLLEVGIYRYELAVVVRNNFFANGQLQTEWKTIKLYLSDFRVVDQKGNTVTVKYDACGGTAELNAAELSQGQSLNTLPNAIRENFTFAGWYTAAEGGEKVGEDFVIHADVTLYAHWEATNASGWYEEGGRSYYMLEGQRILGFFQADGVTYFQGADGFISTGWLEDNGLRYYFNANGAMATGWLELDDCRYYLANDGTATIGWLQQGDAMYYFAEDGLMCTGKQIIEGVEYTFGEDGAMIIR